jgi:hypothetical protein
LDEELETYLLLGTLSGSLDSIPAFDHVGLEAYRPGPAVEFEEETARIAEDGADFITAPERSRGGLAVLAYGLELLVSQGCGHFWRWD